MPGGGFKDYPENINRNGRPKKGEALTDILKEYLNKEEKGILYKQKLIEKLYIMGMEGNFHALKYIIDRIDGMPVQTQIVESEHIGELAEAFNKIKIDDTIDE